MEGSHSTQARSIRGAEPCTRHSCCTSHHQHGVFTSAPASTSNRATSKLPASAAVLRGHLPHLKRKGVNRGKCGLQFKMQCIVVAVSSHAAGQAHYRVGTLTLAPAPASNRAISDDRIARCREEYPSLWKIEVMRSQDKNASEMQKQNYWLLSLTQAGLTNR